MAFRIRQGLHRCVDAASAGGMRRRFGALARCTGGFASVEWALIASFLVTLLVGVAGFAVTAHHKMQMSNAVRAGMQYATVRKPVQGDVTGIENAVAAAAPEDETGTRQINATLFCQCADGSAVACDGTCFGGDRRSFVEITMQEEYEPFLKLPFMPDRFTFQVDGTVRLN